MNLSECDKYAYLYTHMLSDREVVKRGRVKLLTLGHEKVFKVLILVKNASFWDGWSKVRDVIAPSYCHPENISNQGEREREKERGRASFTMPPYMCASYYYAMLLFKCSIFCVFVFSDCRPSPFLIRNTRLIKHDTAITKFEGLTIAHGDPHWSNITLG